MIPKELQNQIIEHLTKKFANQDLGMLIFRAGDGSLVIYFNDTETTIRDSIKITNQYSKDN